MANMINHSQPADIKRKIAREHNALPFEHVVETERIIAAVRPYASHNLYDRIRYSVH
jgi:hypothetical protein